MTKGKRQIINYVLIFGFLISTVCGCLLAAQKSFMMHDSHSTAIAACCDSDNIFGGASHNIPTILGKNKALQLLLLAFISTYLFIQNTSLSTWSFF